MPSLRRLSAPTPARFVLCVLAFVSIAAPAAFLIVAPPASSACPVVVIPKPLRLLYQESALVAVARAGDSVPVEQADGSRMTKTALRISSLLKGESKERVVNLYRYVPEEPDESSLVAFEKDDVLLVFLDPDKEGDGYVSTDFERGLKKLSPGDLKVYLSRLEELALILRSKKSDAAALTEWLVRCAEERATRWEGAYELASGSSLYAALAESAAPGADADAATNTESSVAVVKTDGEQAPRDGEADERAAAAIAATDAARSNEVNQSGVRVAPVELIRRLQQEAAENEMIFAALLTPAQKERLTLTLLAAEELDEGEQTLLRLVGNWKDARLVPFGLKHLARMADQPPYHAEELLRIVAHTLDDRTLIEFAAGYTEAASYEDLYDIEKEYSENREEDTEATPEERAATKKEIEEMKAAAAEARFRRSGKMRHFLALADQPQMP